MPEAQPGPEEHQPVGLRVGQPGRVQVQALGRAVQQGQRIAGGLGQDPVDRLVVEAGQRQVRKIGTRSRPSTASRTISGLGAVPPPSSNTNSSACRCTSGRPTRCPSTGAQSW
jgi:hypothetical protein